MRLAKPKSIKWSSERFMTDIAISEPATNYDQLLRLKSVSETSLAPLLVLRRHLSASNTCTALRLPDTSLPRLPFLFPLVERLAQLFSWVICKQTSDLKSMQNIKIRPAITKYKIMTGRKKGMINGHGPCTDVKVCKHVSPISTRWKVLT